MTLQEATAEERVEAFLDGVTAEMDRAEDLHGMMSRNRHEFYGILLEELDELWDEIKQDGSEIAFRRELTHVVSTCLRFVGAGGE